MRKSESHSATITKTVKSEHATFQEKNGLHVRSKSPKKKHLPPLRRKSLGSKKSTESYSNLEHEIQQLQLQHERNNQKLSQKANPKSEAIIIDPVTVEANRRKSFDRISQIGRLDPKKIDLTPNRSSTPNKLDIEETQVLPLKQFQFKNVK